jgi:cold shock CspA family protein
MSSRATEGKPVMSHTSGMLMYWNAHTGFGEIELDNEDGRVTVYRADLLRAGVKAPQVGDRFHVSTGVADTAPTKRRSRLFDFRERN